MNNFLDILDGIGLFLIIIAVFLLIITIRLICAIFEMNDNIKDIRKIIIKDYNEKHPDDKFTSDKDQKHIAYKETDQNEMLH